MNGKETVSGFLERMLPMKIKKLASLLIACVMVVSMAMPAFANPFETSSSDPTADSDNSGGANADTDTSKSLNFVGTTSVPTISVDLSSEASIVLNPYGLTVDDVTEPFISDTVYLTSSSDCAVAVTGSFTPTITGGVKLVDTAAKAAAGTNAKPVDKNVFVQVVMGEVASTDTAIDFVAPATANTNLASLTAAATYADKIKAAKAIGDFTGFRTATSPDTAEKGIYVLKTADTAVKFGDAADTNTTKLPYVLTAGNDNAQVLAIRLFGLCEKWVSAPWTASDTVSVALALTITPNAN
jgi:hypothetical protein